MRDLHWRYNNNTKNFEFIENNPHQHYEPLLKHVRRPTLVIDVNLLHPTSFETYVQKVLDLANKQSLLFDQIIFDSTQDPVNDCQNLIQELDRVAGMIKTRCNIALSQTSTGKSFNATVLHYPSWFFVFKKQSLPSWNDTSREYSFSCLNRTPTIHRLVFYSMIKQQGLLDDFVFSYYDRCPYKDFRYSRYHYQNLSSLVGDSLSNEILQNLSDFPIAWKNEKQGINDHTINHDAYFNTWCNVVTETSPYVNFTSEKIWKPIAAGQLFFVVGGARTLSWLQHLGFDIWHNDYDSELEFLPRIHTIVDHIKSHQQDVRDWWQTEKFKIEHNFHWFHSGNVEKKILDPLINMLNN